MTQPIKSDAVTLLALGSRMGLQGFKARPVKGTDDSKAQPVAIPKPASAANCDRADAATVMALAKSARLQCIADGTGAL